MVAALDPKKLTAADFVAISTAIAITSGAVYNWAFFRRYDASLISLLTIQDHLAAALVGFSSLVAGMAVGILLGDVFFSLGLFTKSLSKQLSAPSSSKAESATAESFSLPKLRPLQSAILAAGCIITCAGVIFIEYANYYYIVLAFLTMICGLFLIFSVFVRLYRPTDRMSFLFGCLAIFLVANGIGRGNFESAALNPRLADVYFKDGRLYHGKIIRVSAEYIFGIDNDKLIVIPLREVENIGSAGNI